MVVFRRISALIMAGAAVALAACTPSTPDYTPPPTPPSSAAPSSTAPTLPVPAFADPKLVSTVLGAATDAVVAINTYSYRHLDKDRDAARKHSTGAYRTKLDNAFDLLENQVDRTHAVQQATVDHAGLVTIGPKGEQANVLVGGTLRTARENADATTQRFTAVVAMTKVHDNWLASGQDAPDGVTNAPRGNDALHNAFAAAKAHLPTLYTFRHKYFDDDYEKALAATTGDAHTALAARRDAIDAQMHKQQTDSKGTLRGLSVVSVTEDSGGSVEVFALLDASTQFEGVQGTTRHWQLDATLVRVDKAWLIAQFTATPVG